MAYRKNYRKKGVTKKKMYKSNRSMVRKVVKDALAKEAEIKRYSHVWINSTGSNVYHNEIHSFSPVQALPLGTSDGQRLGQQIFLRNVKVRLGMQATNLKPNVRFRVLAFWHDKEIAAPPGDWDAGGIQPQDIFHANTYGTEIINGLINLKTSGMKRLLFDRLYSIELDGVSLSGNTKAITREFNLRINKEITFKGSGYLSGDQLYVSVIPYIGGGTNNSTEPPFFEITSHATYTDL